MSNVVLFYSLQFSHLAWIQTDRKAGGLGDLNYPLVADLTKSITKAYDVMIEDEVSWCSSVVEEPGPVPHVNGRYLHNAGHCSPWPVHHRP